jgi:hypothetical protein
MEILIETRESGAAGRSGAIVTDMKVLELLRTGHPGGDHSDFEPRE